MKVLLINPATGLLTRAPFDPLGLLSIATYLKENGHTVLLSDRTIKRESIKRIIKTFKPDIVGISVLSTRALKDALNISHIFNRYKIPVVWGGHMASIVPEQVMDTKSVDFIIIGEGEKTFLELINAINEKKPYQGIDGLVFTENDKVCINDYREFADLSEFPVIDWSFINPKKYFQSSFHCKKMLYIYASKGCPGNCTFCATVSFHRCTYRPRPSEYFLNEIEILINKFGMDGVYFTDELWGQKRERVQEICQMITEKNLHFVWGCQTRIGQFSKKDYQLMYDAGCRWVLFGIESGSKEVLKRIKKGIDLSKIAETLTKCTEIGITTICSFLIGFPEETEEELKETVKFALSLDINLYVFNHLTPLPGSEIFDEVTNDGSYIAPISLSQWGKIKTAEEAKTNLTMVPTRDLLVIRSFFMWLSFSRKDSVNRSKPFALAKKVISDAFSSIFRHGFLCFITGVFSAAKVFLSVIWNVFAYPKIRNKYGLYKNQKK